MRNFFRKKLFCNISVVLVIFYILKLEKQFIKNQYYLYYQFCLSFSEAVVCNYKNCCIRKIVHKVLPNFTCNLIIKETPTHVCFCEFSKFFKKPVLQNICKWLVLDFEQFYMSHFIIYFIKRYSKKLLYFESIQQDFNIGELLPKEIIRFENGHFRYIFLGTARLEFIHQGMNK